MVVSVLMFGFFLGPHTFCHVANNLGSVLDLISYLCCLSTDRMAE